jgi:hypothetical protein
VGSKYDDYWAGLLPRIRAQVFTIGPGGDVLTITGNRRSPPPGSPSRTRVRRPVRASAAAGEPAASPAG